MPEKVFTCDVEKISNGYLIYHDGKKVYRENCADANCYVEQELMTGMHQHIIDNFPKGTVQRLVVTVGVEGKVME